ncbi:MAG TPA: hypothetical protein VH041_06730 [Caldimonas sp.]|nr:hypothetical protein [Caldimonas sp.]HEX4233984.1 hypothetical protein [Caldimonas sp.]
MKRRAFVVASAHSGLVLALASATGNSSAQRPTHPIAGPPRPGGVFGPGRLPSSFGDVNRTLPPGIFMVRGFNERENVLLLGDADGRTARVLVDPAIFDLSDLQAGDEIVVDFVVPASKDAPLRAAGIWMK